jgi:hypothetical protein
MTEKSSFQLSETSCQPFANTASHFAKDTLPKAIQSENANTAPCRITCDETAEDFRLTLCRTLCAGACPRKQEFIRENPPRIRGRFSES